MATMADVARLAGVSVSTVSYALSGTRPISVATRERIEQAMRSLGYTPNAFARGLKSKRSRIVALIVPAGHNLRLSVLDHIVGACDQAQEQGYHLMLWTADPQAGAGPAQLAGQGLVDGALMMDVHPDDPRLQILSGLPFVVIGRPDDPEGTDHVDVDFDAMGVSIIRWMKEKGHHRIGFVLGGGGAPERGEVRLESAVRAAAAGTGITTTTVTAPQGGSTSSGVGRDPALARLAGMSPLPSALIAGGERVVPGLLHEIRERGLRIPEDLSILAFDLSARAAALTVPPLCTVGPSGAQIGRAAMDLLLRRLAGDSAPARHVLLREEMQFRGSCGPVSSDRRLTLG